EILYNEYNIKNNKFYISIDKTQKDKNQQLVKIVLDGNLSQLDDDLKTIRDFVKDKNQNSLRNRIHTYIKSKYGITLHTLRSIYADYIYTFRNPDKMSKGDLVNDVLNHQQGSGSNTRYDFIKLDLSKDHFL